MNKRKRLLLGLGLACGLHLFIALFLPRLATFLPQPLRTKIIEVNIVDLKGDAVPESTTGNGAALSEQKSAKEEVTNPTALADLPLPTGNRNSTPINKEEHSVTSVSGEGTAPTSEKMPGSSSAISGSTVTGNGTGSGDNSGAGRPGEGELATKPRLLSGGKNYPGAARSAGQQGTVLVSITINTTGQVTSASLAGSSGYPLLDSAAVNAVYSWSFRPAADPYGTPLSYTGVIPIEYSLN